MKKLLLIFTILSLCGKLSIAQNYYYSLEGPQQVVVPPTTGTVISNVNELIAGLKSGADLFLNPGNYTLPSTLYLNDISNLQVTGADGAVITGSLVTLIQFRGTANSITFKNIGFNSTSSYTSGDAGAGIVYFDGSAEDILFENCDFTCPKVVSNGLKFVSEGVNRSKNITIIKCDFHDIGRMAIETQNHDNDGVIRLTDVSVTECNFNRLGLQSPYGMAISLSGSGKNAVISANTIVDAKDRAIETVGWRYMTIADNTISSPNTASNPIAIQKDGGNGADYMVEVVVTGNTGTVYGNSSHLITIKNCDGLIYRNNSFHADALYFGDVKNSTISDNVHYSDGGIGLYVDDNSSYNTFENNTFATTADNANTVVFYPGSTGNTLINNTLIKEGAGGSLYIDSDGGNERITN
jgi:parallel beta-helix repeat protein